MTDRTLFVAGDPMAGSRRNMGTPEVAIRPGIPFTQHLMPDGRQLPQWIDRPGDIEARAKALIERGCSFHVELLSDWLTVSLTVQHADSDEGDIAIELVPNGPGVPEAVDDLVAQAEKYFEGNEEDEQ